MIFKLFVVLVFVSVFVRLVAYGLHGKVGGYERE